MITWFFHRKRLFFWLLRAYVKKRKSTITSFFVAGVIVAAIGYLLTPKIAPYLPKKTENIGIIGSYTIEALPIDIQNRISLGLTKVSETGDASPSAALSYEVSSDGKTYTFSLRNDLFWQDGKKFTAHDVNYNFKDVETAVTSDTEIIFKLTEPFAPFPTVVSQPLFRKGLVGLSVEDKVTDIKRAGSVINSLTLEGRADGRKRYKFYPNEEEAKVRFMLGEIDSLVNLVDAEQFQSWKNVITTESTSENQLVTVFYNTAIPLLSDKAVRQALTYALPSDFGDKRAFSPLQRASWAYVPQNKYTQNIDTAKKLLGDSKEATAAATIALTLTTTPQFEDLANRIKDDWGKIGVETTVDVVTTIPSDPQVLLERFRIPNDPDQYILWHSTQATNISHYANPKIDKLLEDGRQVTNQEERAQIYADFQKHIIDESPAAFLYYPTVYTISRK